MWARGWRGQPERSPGYCARDSPSRVPGWRTRVTQNELVRRPLPLVLVVLLTMSLVLAMSLVGGATPVQADPAPKRILSGWMPYWMTTQAKPQGIASVVQNADLFVDVSPFWYSATAKPGGGVQVKVNPNFTNASTNIPWAMGQLRAAGVTVLPAIADSSGKGRMAAALADPAQRAAHVADLVAMVMSNGYDGLDLDYEGFAFSDGSASWPATQPNWTAFVQELSTALHAQGKLLSVTIPSPCDTRNRCGGQSGYWVYNLPAIAQFADRIRIMAYDFSVQGIGPIAPIGWVTAITQYAVSVMDPAKLQIGVPTYGRAWTKKNANGSFELSGSCPNRNGSASERRAWGELTDRAAFTSADAPRLLARSGIPESAVTFDAQAQESRVEYDKSVTWTDASGAPQTCIARRISWFVGPDGVLARTQLVGTYGLNAAAYWTIGGENPAQWPLLRSYAQSLAPATATVALTAPPSVVTGQPVAIQGSVLVNGAPGAGVPVVLQFAPQGTADFVDLQAGVTGADGVIAFQVVIPSSGVLRIASAATATAPAGISTEATIAVGSAVTTRLRTDSVSRAGTIKVRVIVRPAVAQQRVLLQRLNRDGSWEKVSAAKLSAKGRVLLTGTAPASKGRYTYRVIAPGGNGVSEGISPTFQVRVRR